MKKGYIGCQIGVYDILVKKKAIVKITIALKKQRYENQSLQQF